MRDHASMKGCRRNGSRIDGDFEGQGGEVASMKGCRRNGSRPSGKSVVNVSLAPQ